MSMSLWAYSPEKCEVCITNDCDHCYKADLEVRTLAVLERVSQSRATPAEECGYPRCEECDKYHGHYCTVPIVVSKQIYRLTEERIAKLEYRVADLLDFVTDKILGSQEEPHEETNMTWADYFEKEDQ